MGRHDKPHQRLNLRFDGYIYERVLNRLEKENKNRTKKRTVTNFIETAVEAYLNYLADEENKNWIIGSFW